MKRCPVCNYWGRGRRPRGNALELGERVCEECIQDSDGGALKKSERAARRLFETSTEAMLLREIAQQDFPVSERASLLVSETVDAAPPADRHKLEAFYLEHRRRAVEVQRRARARAAAVGAPERGLLSELPEPPTGFAGVAADLRQPKVSTQPTPDDEDTDPGPPAKTGKQKKRN